MAFSLSEAEQLDELIFLHESTYAYFAGENYKPFNICIDLAQGSMECLLEVCASLKDKYGDYVNLMTGNIANPETYIEYCKAGIDYVRCSIGTGNRCTTSCAVGVHYGNATLLDEINSIRKKLPKTMKKTKVIADGGIDWYDKIQKSIALGADAVMIGKLFAECEEACGEVGYALNENEFSNGNYFASDEYLNSKDYIFQTSRIEYKPYRMYRGMSHRSAQKLIGGDGSKVSEGICKPVRVKYKLPELIENINAYLRSCMSYTNSETIDDLKMAEVVILGGSGKANYSK